MARRDLVVVGASAGGIEALRTLLGSLPPDFSAAVLVVLHIPATGRSALPEILARSTPLLVRRAVNGAPLEPGTVTVAVPDHHLMVVGDRLLLSRGPRENGHRPAVDVLFRTAARTAGPRVVAVVLSGALDDGTAGMIAVRERGGVGVAQDPEDAIYPSMPTHAIEVASVDHVAPAAKMGSLLEELVGEDVSVDAPEASELMDVEAAMAEFDAAALNDDDRPGTPSGFGCPSCHGALFAITEGGMERFRCRVGHAWSPEALAAEQAEALEGALWMALRGLEERAALSLRMGERAQQRGHAHTASSFRQRHDEAQAAALLIRRLLQHGELDGGALPDEVTER
ncbi:two-component system, chemotaxis family, response regulator CheB [Geodermatophilus dictyosporus]|uniref:protein-glutamate methylesterase n=1 Tax=Geodermatophilus dictyosporus TaxID=1523247 RepID=A0A1I5NHK9_9ACTN|nr:chemotaxis protein CheB [Geodermatophilus dictyosporus]SFP21192.1 two-component system, chemotaxis family, response regulator CheB [Geodermatophilus dictyosporus]